MGRKLVQVWLEGKVNDTIGHNFLLFCPHLWKNTAGG